ncbi:MAG: hypothetical protein JRF36_03170 [Deltaproteobacteria bacterium]|jgi:hypothetical protein|nr:hypothetical protein [Deltaproteobacteria bacterium]
METIEVVHTPLLRERSRKKDGRSTPELVEKEAPEQEPEEEEYILCRQCSQAITRPAERITVQGSHQHTFANPHGIVFEIGCFKTARGCGYAGPPSFEFTWFSGYAWRVCYCTMCLTHLGWIFIADSGDIFHGFILDRLIEPQ